MIRTAVDTNVLVYAADHTGDSAKHATAGEILRRLGLGASGVLSAQALSEFYNVAVRKRIAAAEHAERIVASWQAAFYIESIGILDVQEAIRAHRSHGLSFWDTMMWAVVRRAGARFLLSEDLQDGRELEGVTFLNPFNPSNQDRMDLLWAAL